MNNEKQKIKKLLNEGISTFEIPTEFCRDLQTINIAVEKILR